MVNSEFGIAASSYVNLAEDEAQMVGMTQPARQSVRLIKLKPFIFLINLILYAFKATY